VKWQKLALALSLGMSIALCAQDAPPGAPEGTMMRHRPPMEHVFPIGMMGKWWNNPELQQKIGITTDQQKRMDDIFQQNRMRLIDLHANLEREEATLDPLISNEQPDENKIVAQIDRVAQARAELEKQNARMLVQFRRTLTPEQWKSLQAMHQSHSRMEFHRAPAPGGAEPVPHM
jgi:periplasmic protein CpxP/Spy